MKQSYLLIITILIIVSSSVASAERMAVKSQTANIRSGPGTTYDVLWKVEKFYPVFVLKKTGKWYNFKDFEGDHGWIHKSLVGKISSIITTKDKCNIRSGPGTGHEIVFTAEKGIPFKVIKRKGNWIYVRHADGDKGWIYKSLVW